MPLNQERCLLDGINDLRVRVQINFIAKIIKENKAERIIETGIHKAMFCYVARLCNASVFIDTFGDLPESQKAVDILNQEYGKYICFHSGDSRETLSGFSPGCQIDFAWIDGGHSFEVCLSDLRNCARLQVVNIAVDDYGWNREVRRAVDAFIRESNYSIKEISDLVDYRGIIYLARN